MTHGALPFVLEDFHLPIPFLMPFRPTLIEMVSLISNFSSGESLYYPYLSLSDQRANPSLRYVHPCLEPSPLFSPPRSPRPTKPNQARLCGRPYRGEDVLPYQLDHIGLPRYPYPSTSLSPFQSLSLSSTNKRIITLT